jgi:hypothetical protein
MQLPKLVNSHSDHENDEIAIDLGGHAAGIISVMP